MRFGLRGQAPPNNSVWHRGGGLLLEPDVFQAPAVVHAVNHRRQALDLRMPAGRAAGVEDDRPRPLLLQPLVDIPDHPLTLFLVGFGRLSPELLFELVIAVAGEVAVGFASIALVKLLV